MPLKVSNKGAKRTDWRQALGEKSSPCVKPVVESPRARSLRPREERRGDGPGKLRTGWGSRGPRVERGRPHRGPAVRTRTPASSWVRPGAPPPCSQGMASESAPWFPRGRAACVPGALPCTPRQRPGGDVEEPAPHPRAPGGRKPPRPSCRPPLRAKHPKPRFLSPSADPLVPPPFLILNIQEHPSLGHILRSFD